MKRILTILLLSFTTIFVNAQITQYIGSPSTIVISRGVHHIDSSFTPPFDTLSSSPIGSFAIKNNNIYFKTSTGWNNSGAGPTSTIAKLRTSNLSSPISSYYISDKGKEGFYLYDASDNSSADNTGTIIVDAGNHRYKRVITTNYVNAVWFGAIGDGTTNSTAAIQAAIDFCVTSGANSRIVYIPQSGQGSYMVDSIKIKNASIIGDNSRTTITARASSASGLFVLADTPVTKITIANLRLFGNASNAGQHCFNITAIPQTGPAYTGGLWNSNFENIEIQGFKGYGLYFYCQDGLGDMANQFLTLDHITVTSTANVTSGGLYVEGQMGQLGVYNCEFDGQGASNAGTIGVDLKSILSSNDQVKNVLFYKTTIQNFEKAVHTYFAQVVSYNSGWIENDSIACHATNGSRIIFRDNNIANVAVGGGYIFGNDASKLDVLYNGIYGSVTGRFYTSPAGSPGGGDIVGNYGQAGFIFSTVFVAQNVNGSGNALSTGYFKDIVTNGVYSKSLYINTINSNLNPGEELTIRQYDASNPNSFVAFNKASGNIDIPTNTDSGFLILRGRGAATFKRSDLLNNWVLVGLSQPPTYSDSLPASGSWFTGEVVYNNNPSTGTSYWVCKQGGQPGTWDSVLTSKVKHPLGSGPAPTSSGLGANVTSLTVTGTDANMKLVLVTSGAVAGTLGTVTYNSAWPNTPIAVISYADATTGNAIATTSGGYIAFNATNTSAAILVGAITAAGTYTFNVRTGGN